jgi:NAD(P)-dependent dehydrogenase (short-subunit alcohol dehydrogenase family)
MARGAGGSGRIGAGAGRARAERFDVGDEAAVVAAAIGLRRSRGGLTLVCNAAGSANTELETLSLAAWNSVISSNLDRAVPAGAGGGGVVAGGGRSIVTIASTRAHMSEAGTEAYSASKGGLLALSHALAASLAPCG